VALKLSILYRGPLASCNYGCDYCPFAKHAETAAEHAADARALQYFVGWVTGRRQDQLSILFTPWGEGLNRSRYQRALIELTGLPQVEKAAIQTNLSCRLDWVEACDKRKLALWTTFHPTEVERARFVAKCWELAQRGVRFSVGAVGLKEHAAEIAALRAELPPSAYLWINAYKRVPAYYDEALRQQFTTIDPLFSLNEQPHPSQGRACRAGQSVISVDGDGVIRRCHFISAPLGNIYEPGFEQALQPRACSSATCGCHIGYVHLEDLKLYEVFGEGVLERIPQQAIWQPQVSTKGR